MAEALWCAGFEGYLCYAIDNGVF
ncbi:hypothetical protein BN1263170315 [Stenotrophomonas maltophilia]|nr:hypothetical protein BN1263170315 [Stenotrophomonas maltophilia]